MKRDLPVDVDVAVVGGGPVGLALGGMLARAGVNVIVLEQRMRPSAHSRSIGIHPPALAALEATGATEPLTAAGVQVRRGVAWGDGRRLGAIEFGRLPGRYRYVLTVPQHQTEAILADALETLEPRTLWWGAAVEGVDASASSVDVRGTRSVDALGTHRPFALRARFVVGCDGRESTVRSAGGIGFERRAYPDTYVMGDVVDETDLGTHAAIYLTAEGVVESFPLPGGVRRWVVKIPRRLDHPTAEGLARLVRDRVGVGLDPARCTMLSSFGVERGRAARLVSGRVVLAGDSGHLVPPLGGQGMNMGWLDAADLSQSLAKVLAGTESTDPLAGYEARRRRAWRIAQRRADWNLRLGRAWTPSWPRDLAVRVMLSAPLASRTARTFTMHGLD